MEKKLVRETFFKFFTTSLASSLVLSVLSMTDLIIAGHAVGEGALAAVSLALPVIMTVQIVAALWGMGGAIVFSARLGEGDLKACGRTFTLALLGAGVTGLFLGAAGLWGLEPLVGFLGAKAGEERAMAVDYIGILLVGFPFLILSPVMVTFLRNDSRQGYSMFCVVSSSVLNVICSLFFSLGLGLGIRGIGGATVLSQAVCCAMAAAKLFRQKRSYGLRRDFLSLGLAAELMKPGVTVALIFFCQVILTVVVNRILNREGGAAVYAVVKYMINLLFALFDGVTGAVQPMLGIYYGEKEEKNISLTARYAFGTMMALAFMMFLVMEFGGGVLCRLFGVESPAMAAMTVTALRIMGLYCFGGAGVTFLNGFYRCVGKARVSFFLGLADNLVLVLAAVFFYTEVLSMGIMGVFLGIGSSSFLTLLAWCVLCKPWRRGALLLEKEEFPVDENQFHQIVPASYEQVCRVMDQVEEYGQRMGIPAGKQFYINLSIEELIINVAGLAEADNTRKKRRKEYYADIRITPGPDGVIGLRIRDNLTEWIPGALDMEDTDSLVDLDEAGDVNELGIGLIKRIARSYNYKRTIGFNNFSVTL